MVGAAVVVPGLLILRLLPRIDTPLALARASTGVMHVPALVIDGVPRRQVTSGPSGLGRGTGRRVADDRPVAVTTGLVVLVDAAPGLAAQPAGVDQPLLPEGRCVARVVEGLLPAPTGPTARLTS